MLRVRGSAEGPSSRRRLARVPIELVGLGLALWAWSALGHPSLVAQGTSAPGVGAAFLAFPILFVVSLAALAARLTVILFSSRRFRSVTTNSAKPIWLASRRLSGAPFIAAVSLGSTAAAIGVLVYASALTTSQDATLNAKAALFVGSNTSVQLISPGPLPATLRADSTEVLTFSNAELNGQNVDVLGVDPSTFARGAFWDRSFADRSLDSLLSQLAAGRTSGGLPVIVAGGSTQTASESLRLPTYGGLLAPTGVNVVGSTFEFPGESSMSPLVVTNASLLQRLDGQPTTLIWSKDSERDVLSDLARANQASSIVVSASDVLDQTTFAAISWTFAYLQALGVLSGAVIIGGLLLFVTTRAAQRALAYVLSRRMGLRRITHLSSLAIELGVMIAPGAILGGLFGWIAVELAQPHLDPLPLLSPPPLLEVPYSTIAAAVGAALLVWIAVSGWAQHAADRSRASELLRADA
jgi:putative ABC transport system permease protein